MDLGGLSADVVPYVSVAVAAYGGAVVQRATDTAVDAGADATVGWGRRLLARLFASDHGEQVADAVRELVQDPTDEASALLLRAQVLKALTADPQPAAEVAELLRQADAGGDRYTVTVTSSSGFQIGSHNTQTNVTRPPAG